MRREKREEPRLFRVVYSKGTAKLIILLICYVDRQFCYDTLTPGVRPNQIVKLFA